MRLFGSASVLALLLVMGPQPANGQIPIMRPPMPSRTPGDTVTVPLFRVEPPVSPLGAFWRSTLVPGWGQAILGRRVTGAFFVFWEGVTLGMTLKSIHQRNYQERTNSPSLEAKRQEVQDWAVLLVFNHLMAGMEAFVASLLWDFPAELDAQANASGGVDIGLSLSFR